MTFRSRLVAAVTVLTLVTLGVAFVVVSFVVNREQEHRLDAALRAEAKLDASAAAALSGGDLVMSDKPLPAANDVGPLLKFGAIYGASGAVRARTASFADGVPPLESVLRPPGTPFDFRYGTEHLRGVFVPLPGNGGEVLLLAASRAELDGDAAFLRRAMIVALVLAVMWTATVATWVVRRLTRDHEKIVEVAQRVAAGDLSARVGPPPGDDELAKLGRNFDEMIARLEILVESHERFIALAAHELRSPLTTVYGELSHALRRSRDAESYRVAVEEALDSTRRLKLLAEDLLTLSRVGPDRVRARVPVSLADVVRSAALHVESQAKERGVELSLREDDAIVEGAPSDLERLVRNLLDNAVRYSPQGGRISIGVETVGPNAKIAVSDEGPGIRPDDLEKIFEPFYRGPDYEDGTGAGLGLAIVRQIARGHGGDVRAVTQGAGARFEVTLPLQEGRGDLEAIR